MKVDGAQPKQFTLQAVVKVPAGYGKTGAIKIRDRSLLKAEDRFWLERIVVDDNGSVSTALAETWIDKHQSWRIIFVNKVASGQLHGLVQSQQPHR